MNYFETGDGASLTNWLGQEIRVGSWVYRGARDGNTSSYKVGRVSALHDNGKVTVQYRAENEWRAEFGVDTTGRPGINSVVLIDPTTFAPDVQDAIRQ